ncbi:MAG: hypothetical protein ABGY71_03920 [bacterium]|nr:hypothetical protein [Planctomycetota bacterium]HIL51749.1 hypothetical protein [Planctomycetota bacterium]
MNRLNIVMLALFAGILSAPLIFAADCISEGTTSDYEFDRPALGQAGDPVSAEWACGTGEPTIWESDPISGDDPMGNATAGNPPTTAAPPIENKGGNLSGPNGDTQNNGGFEGDCIEVYLVFTYRYQVTRTVSHTTGTTVEPGGVGGHDSTTHSRTTTYWVNGTKRSNTKEACPC